MLTCSTGARRSLAPIECRLCRMSAVWTDHPEEFLATVCLHYRRCAAEVGKRHGRTKNPKRKEMSHDASENPNVERVHPVCAGNSASRR